MFYASQQLSTQNRATHFNNSKQRNEKVETQQAI